MYRFWNSIVEPLCEASDVHTLIEVGIGQGHMTRLLMSYTKKRHGRLHAIDPSPSCDMITLCAEGGSTFTYHASTSLEVLPKISADLVLIDGDHNWYTVLHELRTINQWITAPIILLHDTGWPYGRRDLYYAQESIPAAYRHLSRACGMHPSKSGLEKVGGLNANLENALDEGGPRNGVKTAVEDFLLEEGNRWQWQELPGIHGLGILVPHARIQHQPALRAFLDSIRPSNALMLHMEAVESDRLRELVEHASLAHTYKEQANILSTIHNENHDLRRQASEWKYTSTILQTEQRQLHKQIDVLERHRTHMQEALVHIHATRTIRWTAWLRKIAGILRHR